MAGFQVMPMNTTVTAFGTPLPQPWSTGICSCFDDCTSCLLGWVCPCVLFGFNVDTLEGSGCCCPCVTHILCTMVGCTSCYAAGYRARVRAKYNLMESGCGDCCTHFFLHHLALCQEYRQLQKPPPSIVVLQTAQVMSVAPISQAMTAGDPPGPVYPPPFPAPQYDPRPMAPPAYYAPGPSSFEPQIPPTTYGMRQGPGPTGTYYPGNAQPGSGWVGR